MSRHGSSAPVSTGSNSGDAAASASAYETSPSATAPAVTRTLTDRPPSASRTLGALATDVMTALASLLVRRYASASGPNSDDRGRAMAPIRKMAINATAVSSDAGLM